MKYLFTIILPTVLDRGLLLPYSVGSVLNQSYTNFELFIIGDGLNDYSKNVAQKLAESDSRVRFFDFPKHIRRGETYRHQLLTNEAKGQNVAYILDRDLWLPNHLETLAKCLEKGNFVSTNYYKPLPNGEVIYGFARTDHHRILSSVAHSMALYKSLPFGWRTTPPQLYTDAYMWDQFAAHKDFKLYLDLEATVLYFKRGVEYPGIPTADRVGELQSWHNRLNDNDLQENLKTIALQNLLEERRDFRQKKLLIKGKTLTQFLELLNDKKTQWLNIVKRMIRYGGFKN